MCGPIEPRAGGAAGAGVASGKTTHHPSNPQKPSNPQISPVTIRPKNVRNGTGAKGGLFETSSDEISQVFSPLTSLAHWGCFVEF